MLLFRLSVSLLTLSLVCGWRRKSPNSSPLQSVGTLHGDGMTYTECPEKNTICEFWLVLTETLTLMYNEHDLVYAHKGRLYMYNETPGKNATYVPPEAVTSADGFHRMIESVNGSLPGPPLVMYEGQTIRIYIANKLLSNSATLHFHGVHQTGTPFFDGVPYITQCPISAGQTFTHEFIASPRGTFWYHSHVGAQRTNGVHGAFIIKPRPSEDLYKDSEDMIMTVGDWSHERSEETYARMIYGNFVGRDRYNTTNMLNGDRFSSVTWASALINGRGRHIDRNTGIKVQSPLTWYQVKPGKRYRFRAINVGQLYPLRISVDGHSIQVIASDGYDIEPRTVESFVIHAGERFDFLLTANQTPKNYWIRVKSMEDGITSDHNHGTEAVLHYVTNDGSTDKYPYGDDPSDTIDVIAEEPKTHRDACTTEKKCVVLNCPFRLFPASENTVCILLDELRPLAEGQQETPEWQADSSEHFLNFAFPGNEVTPGTVNGRKFETAGMNMLFLKNYTNIGDLDCDKNEDCGKDKLCNCHHEMTIPYGKTVQMVWTNVGVGGGWAHPIHLHGHSFYVLKIHWPQQNQTTGITDPADFQRNPDIDCGGGLNFCNTATWANPDWKGGKIPGLNLKTPIRKDTIVIPSGGYAVLRIRTTNPGRWFMHCHVEVHALDGMAMVLNEAPESPVKPPPGFPTCKDFFDDQKRDGTDSDTTSSPVPPDHNKSSALIVTTAVFGVIAAISLISLVILLLMNRKKTKMSNEGKVGGMSYINSTPDE